MREWISEFIGYVNKNPSMYNRHIKNNVRLIEELLSRKNIYYKEADPVAFQKFARLFIHQEGKWAGKSFELDLEQRYIVACVLGIKYYDKAEKRYIRYFNEMDLFVARKWGKDTFIITLIGWFVGLEKESKPWCQIVAENEKQSRRTYDLIKTAVERPPLNKIFVEKKTDKYIYCKHNKGRIEYLSGRTKGKDGDNPSVAIVNEAHEIIHFSQYDALKTGMGGRDQPMMIVISSAGTTPASLYERLYDRNCEILKKKKFGHDDRIFILMFGIDETDDYTNPDCWTKANPGMKDGRPKLSFLKSQFESMKKDATMLNTFIAKHLNRQIGAAIDYYSIIEIARARRKIFLEELVDTYACGGVDLAETTDLCNATAQILTDKGKFIYIQAYFIAEGRLERNSERDKQDYKSMQSVNTDNEITAQLVIITPGAYVQKEYVTQWFVTLRDKYQINFLKIGYDRALSKEWLTDMQENGFSHEKVTYNKDDKSAVRDYGILTEVAQGGWTLSEPIKIIKSLFESQSIEYDEQNKLLPYCFYNLKVRQDANNNLSPHKAKSTGHIDGAIGIFNAFVGYQRAKEMEEYKSSLAELFTI